MNIVDFNKAGKRSKDSVTEQAYHWAAILDGEPDEALLGQFRQWLALDIEHQKEFKRIASMWDGLDHYLSHLLTKAPGGIVGTDSDPSPHSPYSNPRLAIAACVLAIVTVGTFLLTQAPFLNQYNETHTTLVGEIRQIALPDGSDLQLNTNTEAEVNYQDNARLVHLVSGEAHFDVAHEPDKPFIVYAGDIAVKAIGTAFSVYINEEDQSVEVIVSEGTVELSALEKPTSSDKQLTQRKGKKTLGQFSKGQRTLLAETIKAMEKKSEQELTKELSWRNGMLIFDKQPLEEVVREISRYTDTEITVLDDSIRNMEIGGYFPAGQTDILLSTLEESFNIEVNRVNDSLIQLSAKK